VKQIKVPKEQTPRDYLVVRIQLVHVKKSWLGLKYYEKILTASAVIPDTPEAAVDLTNQTVVQFKKLGVSFPVE